MLQDKFYIGGLSDFQMPVMFNNRVMKNILDT